MENTKKAGKITLVGAGPGDAELLTIKASKAIAAAEVILVDDLVGREVLAHANELAKIIYVGKRGGQTHSTAQRLINELMLEHLSAGKNVVRLKGGDPFIFGRGGEEVEYLRGMGYEPKVINGITSGLAALTSLGAPLTHREHAHGVAFIAGHPQKDRDGVDWEKMASAAHELKLTLVIYMGIKSVERINAGLAKSMPAETPVAVIERATYKEQRHCLTNVGNLQADLIKSKLGSPAVMVVGDVVKGIASLNSEIFLD